MPLLHLAKTVGQAMSEIVPEISEQERARRKKKNLKRKQARQRIAAGQALPPVVGLSREQFAQYFGPDNEATNYDTYADAFILAAKKARRRYEFPLEVLGGVSFPGRVIRHTGMSSGAQ